jgi:nucleoside-diphosphate-sugar epimerase
MNTKRIIVTGGSGKTGPWVIRHLLEQGYEVINVDQRLPAEPLCHTIVCDLADTGQVVTAFSAYGTGSRQPYCGVIHLAAIPRAHMAPNPEVFRVNSMSTYNVLEACAILGIQKVVLASSEASYGICFATDFFEPRYVPVDENHPQLPEDSYGLSKVVNEATAAAFHRRTGMQVLSLRLGNILCPEDHATIRAIAGQPEMRKRILWSYIDARDVGIVCRLGIETEGIGCEVAILAADDTSSQLPTKELIAGYLPGVKDLRHDFTGRESLISNQKIKKLTGWSQQYFLDL